MKGMFGIGLIALGIFVAVTGGFLLNAETVTVCETDWDYVTDISGAFQGERSDMEVDYDPATSITGWSLSPGFNNGILTGVDTVPSAPNTYFVVDEAPPAVSDTMSITAGAASAYSASSTLKGEFASDVTSTRIWSVRPPGAVTWDTDRVLEIPLSALMTLYGTEGQDVIEMTMDPSYPRWPGVFFDSDMVYHYATSNHRGYYEWTGTPVTSLTVYPQEDVARIGESSYPLSEIKLGLKASQTLVVSMQVTALTGTRYISPSAGVAPIYGESVYWCNNYTNVSTTLMLANTNFDGAALDSIVLVEPRSGDGASSLFEIVSEGGRWSIQLLSGTIGGIHGVSPLDPVAHDLGEWPAIAVVISDGKLTVTPAARFVSFGDFDAINVPATFEWDVLGGKPLKSMRFDSSSSDGQYPRLCVTSTTVLIEKGGLYMQNAQLTPSQAFPSVKAVSLRLGSAAHVGTGIVFMGDGSSVLVPVSEDGKVQVDGKWYPFADVTFYWVSGSMPAASIAGVTYPAALYLKGKVYDAGTVWASARGSMTPVMEAEDWTVLLEGVWAPSVLFYTGENEATESTELADFTHAQYRWDKATFVIVMMAVSIVGGIAGSYAGRVDAWDWLAILGTVGILWLIL